MTARHDTTSQLECYDHAALQQQHVHAMTRSGANYIIDRKVYTQTSILLPAPTRAAAPAPAACPPPPRQNHTPFHPRPGRVDRHPAPSRPQAIQPCAKSQVRTHLMSTCVIPAKIQLGGTELCFTTFELILDTFPSIRGIFPKCTMIAWKCVRSPRRMRKTGRPSACRVRLSYRVKERLWRTDNALMRSHHQHGVMLRQVGGSSHGPAHHFVRTIIHVCVRHAAHGLVQARVLRCERHGLVCAMRHCGCSGPLREVPVFVRHV
jgi:hypothetical protein